MLLIDLVFVWFELLKLFDYIERLVAVDKEFSRVIFGDTPDPDLDGEGPTLLIDRRSFYITLS